MSELVKKDPPQQDGFDGYEDGVEGDDRSQSSGIIQGALVKFTNDFKWVTREGDELAPDLELIVVDIARIVQKWEDQKPIETRILAPGERFPDIGALNDAVPRAEWAEGPSGTPQGPWQAQQVAYLLHLASMDKYTYPTGTTGGMMAIRELVDKTSWMRRYRGNHVYPIVTLSDTFMNTRFGGRQRPQFRIVRWELYGGEAALPAPSQAALPSPTEALAQFAAAAPSEKPTAPEAKVAETRKRGKVKEVKPPTIDEELNDEIPWK